MFQIEQKLWQSSKPDPRHVVLPTQPSMRPSMEASMRKLLFLAAATTLASTLALAQTQQSSPQPAPTKSQQNQAAPHSKFQPTTERRSVRSKVIRNRPPSRRTMTDARDLRNSRTYAYRPMGRRHGGVARAGGRVAYGYRYHQHLPYARFGHRAYGYRAYGHRRHRDCD